MEIMIVIIRFRSTNKSMVFLAIVRCTLFTRTIQDGKKTQGHWHKTNFLKPNVFNGGRCPTTFVDVKH